MYTLRRSGFLPSPVSQVTQCGERRQAGKSESVQMAVLHPDMSRAQECIWSFRVYTEFFSRIE